MRLQCVHAVVDEVAVSVGDKQSKDERVLVAGDGLELVDAARRVLKKFAIALKGAEHKMTTFTERRERFDEIQLLEVAGRVLHVQLVAYAVVGTNELGDLLWTVGVADRDTSEGFLERFMTNVRTLYGGRHAISLPLGGCLKWSRPMIRASSMQGIEEVGSVE
jgi:hypothetical protein